MSKKNGLAVFFLLVTLCLMVSCSMFQKEYTIFLDYGYGMLHESITITKNYYTVPDLARDGYQLTYWEDIEENHHLPGDVIRNLSEDDVLLLEAHWTLL